MKIYTHEDLQQTVRGFSLLALAQPLIIGFLVIRPIILRYFNPQDFKMKLIQNLYIQSPSQQLEDAIFTNIRNIDEPVEFAFNEISNPWILVTLPVLFYLTLTVLMVLCIWKIREIVVLAEDGNWFNSTNESNFKWLHKLWSSMMFTYLFYAIGNGLIINFATGQHFYSSNFDFQFLFSVLALTIPLMLIRMAVRINYQGNELKEENELTI